MLFLKHLKQSLQEFTKLPVIIDPANVYQLQEIRLKPQKFKLGKQEYKKVYDQNGNEIKGKTAVYYIASLPVLVELNIRGANNEDSLLISAMKYSALLQHFFKTVDKLPQINESIENFTVKGQAVIKPINIEGNLEPVLFTDSDLEDAKKFPGFQDRFEIELVFMVEQILDVSTVQNIRYAGVGYAV